jgi:cystathionine beta-lyase/cystathionine gamma-synthase
LAELKGSLKVKGKPVIPPVYMTATYKFDNSDDLIDVVQNHSGYIYSRWDNPSVVEVENALAKLEGFDHALGFSSGMAAITTAVMAHVHAGERIVTTREVYGGTFELMNTVLPGFDVEVTYINCWKTDEILAEIDKGLTLLYLESPTNPLLRVVDVPTLASAAHAKGALVLLDATFASPINQHPVQWGVDGVIHSGTKYIGGHHDVTAGFVCCNKPLADRIWNLRKIFGGVMDPMTAFLSLRGLQTLELRIHKHNQNAMAVARFLAAHPKITAVHYPGLPAHPDHEIANAHMTGFGGMLSFEVASDFSGTKQVMDRLKTIKLATSLGGVTSLANQPITNTHAALSPEAREKAGVSENLVRLSVGIESVQLLIDDLNQALAIL